MDSAFGGLSSTLWALAMSDDEPDDPQPTDIKAETNKAEIFSLIGVNRTDAE